MSRVFIVHDDGKWDLTDAKRYGHLVTVFRKEIYPDMLDELPSFRAVAEEKLADFRLKEDYLCIVGSPTLMAICVSVIEYNAGFVDASAPADEVRELAPLRVLRFDRREQKYYVVPLS